MSSAKEQITALREQFPYMPAVELAEKIGVTKQRVSQILIELNLPTIFKNKKILCGCGKEISSTNKFCKECFSKSKRIDLTCFECGKTFQRRRKDYIRKSPAKVFCNKYCFGSYIGKNFGFAANKK